MTMENNSVIIARSTQASRINNITPLAAPVQKSSDKSSLSKEPVKDQNKDQVDININSSPVTVNAMETLKSLDKLQGRSNELAQNIRATDKNISSITDFINQMQSSLSSITKNFPPFNIESKDRQQILMSYISIRQELIKMMVPPPPPPIYQNVSEIWKNVVDEGGEIVSDAIPALQTNSSDSQVALAERKLLETQGSLAEIKTAVNTFRTT